MGESARGLAHLTGQHDAGEINAQGFVAEGYILTASPLFRQKVELPRTIP
jgi:hypothetical protein